MRSRCFQSIQVRVKCVGTGIAYYNSTERSSLFLTVELRNMRNNKIIVHNMYFFQHFNTYMHVNNSLIRIWNSLQVFLVPFQCNIIRKEKKGLKKYPSLWMQNVEHRCALWGYLTMDTNKALKRDATNTIRSEL